MNENDELMSEQELIALCKRDFTKEVNMALRKTKDAFIDQIRDDIIRYVKDNEARQLKSVLVHEKKAVQSTENYNIMKSAEKFHSKIPGKIDQFEDKRSYQSSMDESASFNSKHYDFEEEEEDQQSAIDEENLSNEYPENVSAIHSSDAEDPNVDSDNDEIVQSISKNEISALNEYEIPEQMHGEYSQIDDQGFSNNEQYDFNSQSETNQNHDYGEEDDENNYDIGGFGDF